MDDVQKVLAVLNIAIIAYAASAIINLRQRYNNSKRQIWMREILRRRHEEGTHNLLLPRLMSDGFHYRNFLRMEKDSFVFLLNLIEPMLLRCDTKWRRCISVSERLALTLRYLATGLYTY